MPDIIIEAPQITAEEYKKYYGKEVAIYKNKIVASGRTTASVLRKEYKNMSRSES